MSDLYALKDDNKLTVTFRNHKVLNQGKSEAAKEAVFDEMVVCDVRMPANRNNVPSFPAHSVSHWIEDPETGNKEAVTFAMRFKKQFERFVNKATQVQEGIPLSRVEGITEAEILELKVHSVYTAEQLASLDGAPLKNLGMKGRRLKNLAQAQIDKEMTSQDALKAEIASLRARLDAKEAPAKAGKADEDTRTDAQLKERIKELSGSAPRGNPSRETLLGMLAELEPKEAEAA